MTKTNFMDKYPVCTIEIPKSETKNTNTREIIETLRISIDAHPVAQFIATFDNYTHTKKLDGQIVDGMTDAEIIIFCFGSAIPNSKILAVRPRSIGVCEFEDKFVLEFMEAPNDNLTDVMAKWCNSLKAS